MQRDVLRVNNILEEINIAIKSRREITLRSFLELIPIIGRYFSKKRIEETYIQDSRLIKRLYEAFKLGYVPGGIDDGPEEWQTTTLIFYFEAYHPDNKEYIKELLEDLQKRYESIKESKVKAKDNPENGYELYLGIDAILDLEGLSPPMKHKRRVLQYGNPDPIYWMMWAEEIINCILMKLDHED